MLYKMIPKIVQLMENKSKESKWRMKAVKEKLQIFFVHKRPSEMENVPQKIILRDKLTLGSQILARTLSSSIIPKQSRKKIEFQLPSRPVLFSLQLPSLRHYLPYKCATFMPYQLTRLLTEVLARPPNSIFTCRWKS